MIWLLALIAVLAIGGLVSLSLKTPPKAPRVHTDQQSDSAAKGDAQGTHHARAAGEPATVEQQNSTDNAQGEADKDADKRAEEASEIDNQS